MDADWLAEANAMIDKYQHTVKYPDPSTARQGPGTPQMQGTGRPGMDIMTTITDEADRAPFVKMLAHPALVQRLNWMCGGHFRAEHLGSVIMSRRGTGGQILHGNGEPVYPNISWWDCESASALRRHGSHSSHPIPCRYVRPRPAAHGSDQRGLAAARCDRRRGRIRAPHPRPLRQPGLMRG